MTGSTFIPAADVLVSGESIKMMKLLVVHVCFDNREVAQLAFLPGTILPSSGKLYSGRSAIPTSRHNSVDDVAERGAGYTRMVVTAATVN